jgi:hypothetical protein
MFYRLTFVARTAFAKALVFAAAAAWRLDDRLGKTVANTGRR